MVLATAKRATRSSERFHFRFALGSQSSYVLSVGTGLKAPKAEPVIASGSDGSDDTYDTMSSSVRTKRTPMFPDQFPPSKFACAYAAEFVSSTWNRPVQSSRSTGSRLTLEELL